MWNRVLVIPIFEGKSYDGLHVDVLDNNPMFELEEPKISNCRCGGKPTEPQLVANCTDRWVIRCQQKGCFANNIGQGKVATIEGWNNLSSGFYR